MNHLTSKQFGCLLVALSFITLHGCSTDILAPTKYLEKYVEEKLDIFGTQEVICPKVRILRAGELYVAVDRQLKNGAPPTIAQIETVQASCKIAFPKPNDTTAFTKYAVLVTQIDSTIRLAETYYDQTDQPLDLEYFVAIVSRFGKTMAKKSFGISSSEKYEDSDRGGIFKESVNVNIPIDDLSEAESYEIVVSFQLSEKQLEESRRKDRQ